MDCKSLKIPLLAAGLDGDHQQHASGQEGYKKMRAAAGAAAGRWLVVGGAPLLSTPEWIHSTHNEPGALRKRKARIPLRLILWHSHLALGSFSLTNTLTNTTLILPSQLANSARMVEPNGREKSAGFVCP